MDVKIAPDWKELLAPELRKTLLHRPHAVRTAGIRHAAHLSARQQHLPRLRQMPVRQAESGHHRSGPLPRSRTGQRTLLLGRRRRAVPALAAEYLQGGRRRHRNTPSRDGQPRPLGRAGRTAAERRADRPRTRSGVARRPRLGNLHRRRGTHDLRTQTGHRLHALGAVTPRRKAPSPIRSGTSFSRPYTRRRSRSTADSSVAATSRAPTNISAASARSRSCGNN